MWEVFLLDEVRLGSEDPRGGLEILYGTENLLMRITRNAMKLNPKLIWFNSKADALQLQLDQDGEAISKGTVETRFTSSAVVRDGPGDREAAIFTYRELSFATNSFRAESFLGSGGFGAVYKGKLESTGQVVAVKKLDPSGIQRISGGGSHALPNVVNLAGYCGDADHRLLVHEYMLLGSMEDHLFGISSISLIPSIPDGTPDMEPLDWNTRMKIAAVGRLKFRMDCRFEGISGRLADQSMAEAACMAKKDLAIIHTFCKSSIFNVFPSFTMGDLGVISGGN
ncbi:hypothetical protein OIU79_027185 [Salix purpurea]|uniref:Protein kinase domain-containing protein n=1 Tax=Salix purpurea TaxID=77065 RepID=A0A9Q0VT88_SALPP|nr:hypothetical protein OIU79_027185 [Salix purpurea]